MWFYGVGLAADALVIADSVEMVAYAIGAIGGGASKEILQVGFITVDIFNYIAVIYYLDVKRSNRFKKQL